MIGFFFLLYAINNSATNGIPVDSNDLFQVNGDIKCSIQSGKECGKISTEYRLQFAWPGVCKVDDEIATPLAKKSFSMGTIKGSNNINLSTNTEIPQTTVHKKENVDPKKRYGKFRISILNFRLRLEHSVKVSIIIISNLYIFK